MSRWSYTLGVGIVLVALAFVITDEFVAGRPAITERNGKRIKWGMTAAEVEALLGVESQTKVCVAGPGFYPWCEVKTILTNLEDAQHLQELLKRMRGANPSHYPGMYGTATYYRAESASEKGLEVGFLSNADGGYILVYFGKSGRVRQVRWYSTEELRRLIAPEATPLDRLRTRLGL